MKVEEDVEGYIWIILGFRVLLWKDVANLLVAKHDFWRTQRCNNCVTTQRWERFFWSSLTSSKLLAWLVESTYLVGGGLAPESLGLRCHWSKMSVHLYQLGWKIRKKNFTLLNYSQKTSSGLFWICCPNVTIVQWFWSFCLQSQPWLEKHISF